MLILSIRVEQMHMTQFHDLTTAQLKQAIDIREQIDALREKLDTLMGGAAPATGSKKKVGKASGKRTMSDEARAKIAAAQQARWARIRG